MSGTEESDLSEDGKPPQEFKKPAATRIILSGSNENKTIVLARPSTMVGKLLTKYCEQRNVSPKEYRLIYRGKMMNEEEAIGGYNIQDNDTIDVVAQQVGGALPHYFD